MSSIQKFLLAVLPDTWAKSMEAESREWICTCPLRLGPRRYSLGGRGQSAPALEVPKWRPVDLACGFEEPANFSRLLSVKGSSA